MLMDWAFSSVRSSWPAPGCLISVAGMPAAPVQHKIKANNDLTGRVLRGIEVSFGGAHQGRPRIGFSNSTDSA
jgi:hypothetical protein